MESINRIGSYLEGVKYEDFEIDSMRYFAVVKNLEIVGEASYMLSLPFKESHPDTPWDNIIKMRHILVHGYYQIDADEVWHAAKDDIPPLRMQIERYLQE